MKEIIKEIQKHCEYQDTNTDLLHTILDPSIVKPKDDKLEKKTRRLCFDLHNTRTIALGGSSAYPTTIKSWRTKNRLR